MSSQRVWCPPDPWVTNCSSCGCTALGDPLWVKKLLELSSMPTAVLGNFPQPECLRICLWSQITCHLKITVKHSSILRPWMCWTSSGPSKSPWCQQSPLVFLWPFCSCPLWPLCLALLTVVMPWERKLLVRTEWANPELVQAWMLLGWSPWGHEVTYGSVLLPPLLIHLKKYHLWEGKDVLLRATQWSYGRSSTIPAATSGLAEPFCCFLRILQFILHPVPLKVF